MFGLTKHFTRAIISAIHKQPPQKGVFVKKNTMLYTFPKTRAVIGRWLKRWGEHAKATSINGIALLMLVNMGTGTGLPMDGNDTQQERAISITSVAKTNATQTSKSHIPVIVTAYSSDEDQTDDTPFITASGETVRDGIVAANFLPFGTKIKIPQLFGDKVFVVKDRMAKRFSDRVDVWVHDSVAAKRIGIQSAEIIVL